MKPRLALIPAQLNGFLKVNATLSEPTVRLADYNDDMPVLQIEEAGIVIALEFMDRQSLEAFSTRLSRLLSPHGGQK